MLAAAARMRPAPTHHVREVTMKGIRFGLIAAGLLLAIGTAVATYPQAVSAQGSTRMTLTLNEFSILAETPQVAAGEITFDVVNTGEDVHEVIVIKSDLDISALPPSKVRGEVDEAAVGEYVGGWEDVQPAALASGTLTLGPGRYILLCNLTNHYAKGMVSTLQVN
jgi:uncharacterized cupredoxin-like copper-binding protein